MDQPINPVPEKQTPEIPKDLWENKIPYQPPKASNPVWRWLWISLVILIVVGGLSYLGVRYWSTIVTWFSQQEDTTNNTTDNTVQTDAQIAWQSRTEINDLLLQDKSKISESYGSNSTADIFGHYYKVGAFTAGPYKDASLIIARLQQEGPIGPGMYYFAQKPDGQLTFLVKMSNTDTISFATSGQTKYTLDNTYQITSLIFPTSIINSNNTNQPLEIAGGNWDAGRYFSLDWFDKDTNNWRKIFTDPVWGDVYTDPIPTSWVQDSSSGRRYGFYLKAPDGTLRIYALKMNDFVPSTGIPTITWKDGSINSSEYSMVSLGGCGATNLAAVMPDSLMLDLVQANQTGDTPVYELKNTNHQLLKDLYNQAKSNPTNKGLTYAKFLKTHPLFFRKDSFDRLIKFQSKLYMPQAECGKPVIYLYPEKSTKVTVKVEPQGGLSYSEPDYGKGWTVWAEPSGKLTELITQKVYPYLFWEGRGGLYQAPDKGWVVKQSEVSSFLDAKLAQFGLINQEIADFKEFWLPRMQSAPYYQIGFWGNQEMNRLAPLTISPKPDTIIRILMDFKPLDKPIKINGYSIITPQRIGFTVVEWGGVIK